MTAEPIAVLPRPGGDETRTDAQSRLEELEAMTEPRLRHRRRPVALAALSLALLAFGIWLGRQDAIDRFFTDQRPVAGDDAALLQGNGLDVGITAATDGAAALDKDTIQFVGIVHPGKSAAVTAPFAGHITSIADIALGATVEPGAPILSIDSAEARRELKQAEMTRREAESEYEKLKNWSTSSQVMQAKREVENARRDVQRAQQRSERTKALLDEGIVAASEYEQEQEALEIAKSSLELAIDNHQNVLAEGNPERLELARQRFLLAGEEVEVLEAAIQQQRLIAPQRGILLPPPNNDSVSSNGQSALTIGRAVQKGESLIVIGDIETVQIKTFVSDVDIDRLALGQKARILNTTFGEREVTGIVQSISKYTADFQNANASMTDIGPPVSRYEVIIGVAASELGIVDRIRVGMTVDIEFSNRSRGDELGALGE